MAHITQHLQGRYQRSGRSGWKNMVLRFIPTNRKAPRLVGFKATSVFEKTTIEEVQDVIFDVEAYNEWIDDCNNSELLDSKGKYDLIYHILLKVPFPFDKRDMIQQIQLVEETDSSLKIALTNRSDFIEVNRGVVRMPAADGYWLLQSLENGDVSVVFEYFSDPGGGIPAWMVNMFIVQSPYRTLSNLRAMVEGD